eukprot:scaffold1077_cov191-Alexandrium_tamarense.AAC.19
MHSSPTTSFALIGLALLNNLASGFSCTTSIPFPTSASDAIIRNAPKSSSSKNSSFCKGIHSPLMMRGGGGAAASQRTPTSLANGGGGEAIGQDLNLTTSKVLASLWGTSGVAYILLKAIKRVVPIALEPFKGEGVVPLTQFQLA